MANTGLISVTLLDMALELIPPWMHAQDIVIIHKYVKILVVLRF